MKRALKTAILVLVVLLAYPLWLGYQIWDQSHEDQPRPAGSIVVLGAAQYNGRPSPVFKARLDQAAYLYREGLSDQIIVTGGKRPGDRFTEAEAGGRYLEMEGIPGEDIYREDEGTTTLESLQRVREITEEIGSGDSVLLVSDPLHSERIKRMADDLGFDPVFTSPASYVELHRTRPTKVKEMLHEVVSLIAYELFDR